MAALALVHRDTILDQIRSGKLLREVAASYGVSKQAIHQVLKDDPEYKAAQLDQADSLIEEAKELTWAAREQLDIARAREITKFAFRYAESVSPAKWSPKQDQASTGVTIVINTQDSTGRIIEGEGGVVKAGGEVGEGNPSCMPSSTDRDSSTDNTVLIQDNSESPK